MRAGQLTFRRFWNSNRVTRRQTRSTAKAGPKDVSETPSTPVTPKVAAKSATKLPKATPAKKVAPLPAHDPKRARKVSFSSEEDPSEDELEVEGEEEVVDGEDIEHSQAEEDEEEEDAEPDEQDAEFISNTDDEKDDDDEAEYAAKTSSSEEDGTDSSDGDASEVSEVIEVVKVTKSPKAKATQPSPKTQPKKTATPKNTSEVSEVIDLVTESTKQVMATQPLPKTPRQTTPKNTSEVSEVIDLVTKPTKQVMATQPLPKTARQTKKATAPINPEFLAEVKAVQKTLAEGGENALIDDASPRDVVQQQNASARHLHQRLFGTRVVIYIGSSSGGVVLHFWFCVETKYACVGVTNGDGRTYKRDCYYIVHILNQVVVAFEETDPVHFVVPDLPPSAFDVYLEHEKNLCAIGMLLSVDIARKVTLKTGAETFVREITVSVRDNERNIMVPMAVSLWGERLGKAKLVVGSMVVILNCKGDQFQEMARLSVGDTGTILHNVKTHQAKAMLKQAKLKTALVLPKGLEKIGSGKGKTE